MRRSRACSPAWHCTTSWPSSSAPGYAAAYLGALDSLGTIRPGRAADLVLLDRDPLADIRNTRSITTVIARGRVVDRAALLRRVERASSARTRQR